MIHRLNVGCGPRIIPGFVNTDILDAPGVDVIMDVNKEWPFLDDYFDQVWANHVAEHAWDIVHFVGELWRICKPGAFVSIQVPVCTWVEFYNDPTHHACFTPRTMEAFIQGMDQHDTGLPFRNGPAFSLVRFEQRGSGGWELSWRLLAVKEGKPPCAAKPIVIPAEYTGGAPGAID